MRARRLSADWVLPIEGDPIALGALLVDDEGRIIKVGPEADVPHPEDIVNEHFSGAALIPGLVNAHTHLELTELAGRLPEDDFPTWIRRIRELKAALSPAEFLKAARRGLRDCYAAGVTTIADTGDSGAAIEVLDEYGGSGIAYLEVFGPHPADAGDRLAELQERVATLRRFASERVRIGVSPHAPYTVSGPLYRAVARWARDESIPLAVHLAESEAECRLLEEAEGAFAEAWRARGIPLPSLPGRSPVAWLDEHGVLGESTLCIHLVRVSEADLARLHGRRCGVAHCPRANRRHGHGNAPLARFLATGLCVGMGTDSAASLAPPDLLAEARTACSLASLDAEQGLELCTLGAARAIGLSREVGSLQATKWADCAIVRVPQGVEREAVPKAILASRLGDVIATYVGGREVFRRR